MKKENEKEFNPRTKSKKTRRNSKFYNNNKDGRAYDESRTESKHCFPENGDYAKGNDISWWNKTTGVFNNATNIPFNRIMGDTFAMRPGPTTSQGYYDGARNFDVPGVMTIDYLPAIGTTEYPTDAVNLAMDAMYARIYREYTGAANFTKSELAFHVLSSVQAALWIGEAKRILRCLNSYAQMNHNFPRLLYSAMTGNLGGTYSYDHFSDDIERLPSLRAQLNNYIYAWNSLFIPHFTETFDRWYSLANNVWMDEDRIDASAIIFRNICTWEYQEPTVTEEGPVPARLKCFIGGPINGSNVSYLTTLLSNIGSAITNIRNTTNFGIVNAALGKVLGANELYTIQPFSDDEVLQPVFDKNIAYQVNNMIIPEYGITGLNTAISNTGYVPALDVTEDVLANVIQFKPYGDKTTVDQWMGKRLFNILNSYDGDISKEFQMEATRLMPVYEYDSSPIATEYRWYIPTEMPLRLGFYYNTYQHNAESGIDTMERNGIFTRFTEFNVIRESTGDFAITDTALKILCLISKFRNAPRMWLTSSGAYNAVGGTTNIRYLYDSIGDVTQYTTVTQDGIKGLHVAALLSAYHVGY